MNEILIAPCGMNCSLCITYQFKEKDLNRRGFNKRYCAGCLPRGKNCTHMGSKCQLLGKGKVRFCFECETYPCKILNSLDKRYRTKYHMSMIENLNYIRENGVEKFLEMEEIRWRCKECGGTICCHNGLCMNCNLDTFLQNKKYRWNEEESKKGCKGVGKCKQMNDFINEYTIQLRKGQIQKAYKGIMTFMSELKNHMVGRHPEYAASALYIGYMDMTYFAFTPMELKNKNLKIAVVYLHEQNRFEVWLGGRNRKVQAEYIDLLIKIDIGCYELSKTGPGVDSIIEVQIDDRPDFEQAENLMQEIEDKTIEFANDIILMLT